MALSMWRSTRVLLFAVAALAALAVTALARPALVFDAATGQVLVAEDAGKPWYPASLTKLMTAYVTFEAIRKGELKPDSTVTMTARAAKEPPSKVGFRVGTRLSVLKALKIMLVYSANDIAVALGQRVGGSVEGFVKRMNAAARRLGMTGTRFANPNGLFDPRQITTARDMGILAATIINEYPQYQDLFSAKFVKIGKRRLRNRNGLLRVMENADGMKTGFICASGYNLVASASDNGRRLVAVILGQKSGGARTRLAQVLLKTKLEDPSPAAPDLRLAMIRNVAEKPIDIRNQICRGYGVRMARIEQLDGWGVSFGRFKGAREAEGVLDGQLLLNRDVVASGKNGVLDVPLSKEYVALMWDMTHTASVRLCNRLQQRHNHCEVVAPETFGEITRLAAIEAERRKAARAERAKKRKRNKKLKRTDRARKKAKRRKRIRKVER